MKQVSRQSIVQSIHDYARGIVKAMIWYALLSAIASTVLAQSGKPRGCIPVSERTGDAGCWIIAREPLGHLSQSALFWHLDTYSTRGAAEAAKGPRGTVVEALGNIWLLTIAEAGWRPSGGTRVADIGPLLVDSGKAYTAQYMEGISPPGTFAPVHRHPGPEAWYTTAGELCLETPDGKMLAHAGESTVVQAGPPMQLRATGREQGRWLVLVIYETSQRWEIPASDWTPKGLCQQP
jgi:quercetin dioxygenase-like cupin family protein